MVNLEPGKRMRGQVFFSAAVKQQLDMTCNMVMNSKQLTLKRVTLIHT